MGNSDSQASIPNTESTSFMLPRKPKSYSLRFRPAKQKVLSARSWWRGKEVDYRSRTQGSRGMTQHQTSLFCTPHHYDCFGNNSNLRVHCQSGAGGEGIYGIEGVYTSKELASPWALRADNQRALFGGQDGGLQRTITEVSKTKMDQSSGPVHLIRFSPAMQLTAVVGRSEAAPQPPLRKSKGSSLSSEGSWYDSPWGATGELSDADRSCSSGHTEDICARDSGDLSGQPEIKFTRAETVSSGLSNSNAHSFSFAQYTCSEGTPNSSGLTDCSMANGGTTTRTGDYSINEMVLRTEQMDLDKNMSSTTFDSVNRNPTTTVASDAFPSSRDFPVHFLDFPTAHTSTSCNSGEEHSGVREFTSYTLPCRRAAPVADCSTGKSTLRSRIRRFSDWTGSLSRKKRKLQGNDPESVDSGVDVWTMDGGSPSQMSSLPWYQGSCHASPSPGHTHTYSFPALSCKGGDDDDHGAFRRNVYDTFMRELETVHRGGEPEHSEETVETSSSSGGSLEQLDELLEKERGLVRRAGWLSFKPLISLHKDRRLELVPRRRWRRYWVTLKGCTLLFYETFESSLEGQDVAPHYILFVEDSVVQAVPEHPKKENVFCLSNAYGDVYLFQSANQTDLENWVTAVHSACASLLAKRHGKEDTVRVLQSQIRSLLQEIDMDTKMKKMAELQLSVVSDQRNRKAIENQIQQWEQNLERFNMDLFRVRCYLSSLQGGELPNPKILLAASSRASKMALGRLGIFSVSSFHALVCSRDEATLRRHCRSIPRRAQSRHGLLSSIKGLDTLTRRSRDKKQLTSQNSENNSEAQVVCTPPCSSEKSDTLVNLNSISPPEGHYWDCGLETLICVFFLDNQAVKVNIRRDHTVLDVLFLACKEKHLDPHQHCLFVSTGVGLEIQFSTPAPADLMQDVLYDTVLVFPLNVCSMCLTRPANSVDYGFAVTGHMDESRNSHIFVSEVIASGIAFSEGLRAGDEILVVNGMLVSALDLGLMQTHFSQWRLNLVLRRDDTAAHDHSSTWPEAQPRDPCPPSPPVPPPSPPRLLEDVLHRGCDGSSSPNLICCPPGPGSEEGLQLPPLAPYSQSMESMSTLLPDTCESPEGHKELQDGVEQAPTHTPCPLRRPSTERLRKVIQELIDTEKSYVKDLSCLFEIYLKPLQHQTFLSMDEMESLFGSLPEMLDFQRIFLQTLEEGISSSSDLSTLETPEQLKKLLFSLSGSFLYYADHFKLYSGFCANHMKVQKVLERAKTDQAFKGFLEAKNPTKQHSSTLESYLIKPVQRVLRYPLLLRELVSLTDVDSEENRHLSEALKAMEKVASHINDMQKIYEEYGTVFDQLLAEQSNAEKEITEISMGDFLIHSSVLWLNPLPSLGRMRKDPELTVFVFRKAVILVYRETGRVKKRMTTTRQTYSHGDMDPFKFRWLIPLTALQVRPGGTIGSQADCIWELIHSKSELAGRPETVFQLCSSTLDAKSTVVKVIRSLLREWWKKPGPVWRGSREPLSSERNVAGSSQTSCLRKELYPDIPSPADAQKGDEIDPDDGSQSCGTQSSGFDPEYRLFSVPEDQRCSTPQQPLTDTYNKEGGLSRAPQQDFLTSTIEAQLQKLWIAEEASRSAPCVQPEQVELDTSTGYSLNDPSSVPATVLCEDDELPLNAVPLDALPAADFSALEKEFSVNSLTSMLNEDYFFDKAESAAAIPPTVEHGSPRLALENPSHGPLTYQP